MGHFDLSTEALARAQTWIARFGVEPTNQLATAPPRVAYLIIYITFQTLCDTYNTSSFKLAVILLSSENIKLAHFVIEHLSVLIMCLFFSYLGETEDICIVERLFSSSLVAIVSLSAPRKLKVCHFKVKIKLSCLSVPCI